MNAGWGVFDLGGRAVSAGPSPDAAITTAEALGAMPLRARIAPATAEELERLELSAAALALEATAAPRWWHA